MRRDAGEFESLRPYAPGADAPRRSRADRGRARVEADPPALRPRTLGELLDLAFELLRSRFATYLGVAAAIWVPVRIAQPFIGPHTWAGGGSADDPAGMFLGFAFTMLATVAITFLSVALLSVLAASHYEGRPVSVAAAVRRVLSRSFSILALATLCSVLETLGWLCLCAPGVFLAWLLYLVPTVCVLEDAGIPESIARSCELSWPRFLPFAVLAGVAYLLRLPFESLAGLGDQPLVHAWLVERLPFSSAVLDGILVVSSSLFLGIGTAIRGVVVTVWYFDCRAVREGADLRVRLARAAAESAARAGSPA